MQTIDRASLRRLSDKIVAALQAIAAEEGVTIKAAGGSFTEKNATLKIEIATIGEGGAVNTRAATSLDAYAALFGLSGVSAGTTFEMAGETYRIDGLNTKAHKNPVMVTRLSTGKRYRVPAASVMASLARRIA